MEDPKKYGNIVTTVEHILYDLLQEQRRTNELLEQLTQQTTKKARGDK